MESVGARVPLAKRIPIAPSGRCTATGSLPWGDWCQPLRQNQFRPASGIADYRRVMSSGTSSWEVGSVVVERVPYFDVGLNAASIDDGRSNYR